jgi:hypothetical protein
MRSRCGTSFFTLVRRRNSWASPRSRLLDRFRLVRHLRTLHVLHLQGEIDDAVRSLQAASRIGLPCSVLLQRAGKVQRRPSVLVLTWLKFDQRARSHHNEVVYVFHDHAIDRAGEIGQVEAAEVDLAVRLGCNGAALRAWCDSQPSQAGGERWIRHLSTFSGPGGCDLIHLEHDHPNADASLEGGTHDPIFEQDGVSIARYGPGRRQHGHECLGHHQMES